MHGTEWIFAVFYLPFITGGIVNGLMYELPAKHDSKYAFDDVAEKLECLKAGKPILKGYEV